VVTGDIGRLFVQRAADTMAAEVANNTQAAGARDALDGVANPI
jgi:hypothetical protein